MQNDLISRSALIKEIEKSMKENPHSDKKVASVHNHEHRHFLTMVMQQPTAYSVEKLVEELETEKDSTYERCVKGMFDAVFKDIMKKISDGGKV